MKAESQGNDNDHGNGLTEKFLVVNGANFVKFHDGGLLVFSDMKVATIHEIKDDDNDCHDHDDDG